MIFTNDRFPPCGFLFSVYQINCVYRILSAPVVLVMLLKYSI